MLILESNIRRLFRDDFASEKEWSRFGDPVPLPITKKSRTRGRRAALSGIKLVCRRAACRVYTSVSRLDVNSHKPNNLPQHSDNDSGVASVKNVLICKIEITVVTAVALRACIAIPRCFKALIPDLA